LFLSCDDPFVSRKKTNTIREGKEKKGKKKRKKFALPESVCLGRARGMSLGVVADWRRNFAIIRTRLSLSNAAAFIATSLAH